MKSSTVRAGAIPAPAVVSAPAFSAPVADDQPVTIIGDVVRYEPGHMIVVRGADNNEVTYTLTPSLIVPDDVRVGRHVTLFTTRGDDGSSTVTRVTTSMTPEGDVKRTVERTRTDAMGETTHS